MTLQSRGLQQRNGAAQFGPRRSQSGRRHLNVQARVVAPEAPTVQNTHAAVREPEAPAIPHSIHDISNGNILGFGADLAEDHPGFLDEAYKRRRQRISEMAKAHNIGARIPDLAYLPEEKETWAHALTELQRIIPKYACKEYVEAFEAIGFCPDQVPQLQEMHELLQRHSGWNVRPVAGLMHPRDFLNGLAFKHCKLDVPCRTFHSTQYMRHHSNPSYTPEPDVIHELIGHVPMLINPAYCALAEEIGKASLGATDKTIWHLTKVYWYTIEFGVVREGEADKAFGAGILSSFSELAWMGSGEAQVSRLDPWHTLPKMSYKDGHQQQYFCLDSFESGADTLHRFSQEIQQHEGQWLPRKD